jgi:hypothetical protein
MPRDRAERRKRRGPLAGKNPYGSSSTIGTPKRRATAAIASRRGCEIVCVVGLSSVGLR